MCWGAPEPRTSKPRTPPIPQNSATVTSEPRSSMFRALKWLEHLGHRVGLHRGKKPKPTGHTSVKLVVQPWAQSGYTPGGSGEVPGQPTSKKAEPLMCWSLKTAGLGGVRLTIGGISRKGAGLLSEPTAALKNREKTLGAAPPQLGKAIVVTRSQVQSVGTSCSGKHCFRLLASSRSGLGSRQGGTDDPGRRAIQQCSHDSQVPR